jgi:hypothetical protein
MVINFRTLTKERMVKIIKFIEGKGFSIQSDIGPLDGDFTTKSFLTQILPHLEKFPCPTPIGSDKQYLVFDEQDEAHLMALLKQLVGGMVGDHSMGHERSGEIVALDQILKFFKSISVYIPKYFKRDGKKPLTEIKEWSLAIQ